MKIIIATIAVISTGCAYNSTMGVNDRFQVATTASLFAPSVTTVVDTNTDSASTYAGPSIVGQVAQAAGTVAGGYLLGNGIAKSGARNILSSTATGGDLSSTATGGASSVVSAPVASQVVPSHH